MTRRIAQRIALLIALFCLPLRGFAGRFATTVGG